MRVIITFKSDKDRKFYNDYTTLVKKFGPNMAKRLTLRLQQAQAANNLFDFFRLSQTGGHPLAGDREGEWGAYLVHPQRLIFKPDHDPLPRLADGGLDTRAVTAIKVLRVEDYHGKRKAR